MAITPISLPNMQIFPRATPKFAFSAITGTILTIAAKYFGLAQGIACFGYGAKEIVFDGIIKDYKLAALGENPTWQERTIHKIRSMMVHILEAHGILYAVSSIASVCSELNNLNVISLGALQPIAVFTGNILFLGACALSIGAEILLFKEAIDFSKRETLEEKHVAVCLKTSSILGILGNVGYIISVGTIMLGGGTTLAVIFGVIAIAIGCIKMLYDYKRLEPALEAVNN